MKKKIKEGHPELSLKIGQLKLEATNGKRGTICTPLEMVAKDGKKKYQVLIFLQVPELVDLILIKFDYEKNTLNSFV